MELIHFMLWAFTTASLITHVLGNRVEDEDVVEDTEKQESDSVVTVALLKEMFSGIQSTLQDQHQSLQQQVKLQHENLQQRVDMLMHRQENFAVELREGLRKREERHVTDSDPIFAQKEEDKTVAKASLLSTAAVEHRSCTGSLEEFQRATEEFQILPLSDELIAKMNEMQQALPGEADIFLDAQAKLHKYQAAIRTLFEKSQESARVDRMRFSDRGPAAQSLVDLRSREWPPEWAPDWMRDIPDNVQKAVGTMADKAPKIAEAIKKSLSWLKEHASWWGFKDVAKPTVAWYLKGQAFPMMEAARLASGEHFAKNLYQITVALVQQVFDFIPAVFTAWVPKASALTKITGYWIESRAKIAFQDRHLGLMQSLMARLQQDFFDWIDDSGEDMLDGFLEYVRGCLCKVNSGMKAWLCGNDEETTTEASAEQRKWQEAVDKEMGQHEGTAPSPSGERKSFVKRLKPIFKTVSQGLGEAWKKVHGAVLATVNTIFTPLFFQVAVPIAAQMRMELSKALTSFLTDYVLEMIQQIPFLNKFTLEVAGHDTGIAIIHGYASWLLLPKIFNSTYMENLEQKIKHSYEAWLMESGHFRQQAMRWILSSFSRMIRMGKRQKQIKDDYANGVFKHDTASAEAEELEERTCSGSMDDPEECSELDQECSGEERDDMQEGPHKELMNKYNLVFVKEGADRLHFYVRKNVAKMSADGDNHKMKVSLDKLECGKSPECLRLFEGQGDGAFIVGKNCCARTKLTCIALPGIAGSGSRCKYDKSLPQA